MCVHSHSHLLPILAIIQSNNSTFLLLFVAKPTFLPFKKMLSSGLRLVLRHSGRERWRSSKCQASVSQHHPMLPRKLPAKPKPRTTVLIYQLSYYSTKTNNMLSLYLLTHSTRCLSPSQKRPPQPLRPPEKEEAANAAGARPHPLR